MAYWHPYAATLYCIASNRREFAPEKKVLKEKRIPFTMPHHLGKYFAKLTSANDIFSGADERWKFPKCCLNSDAFVNFIQFNLKLVLQPLVFGRHCLVACVWVNGRVFGWFDWASSVVIFNLMPNNVWLLTRVQCSPLEPHLNAYRVHRSKKNHCWRIVISRFLFQETHRTYDFMPWLLNEKYRKM